MSLLETTRLGTVNRSELGQRAEANHLRVTFPPRRELLERVLPEWIKFHNGYAHRRWWGAATDA